MDIFKKLEDSSHKDESLMAELSLPGKRWEMGYEVVVLHRACYNPACSQHWNGIPENLCPWTWIGGQRVAQSHQQLENIGKDLRKIGHS